MTEHSPRLIPVACSLDDASAETQLAAWRSIGRHRLSVEPLVDGVVVRYPRHLQETLNALIEQERQCCSFLDMETSVEADQIEVSIRSDQTEGRAVVDLLVGLDRSES